MYIELIDSLMGWKSTDEAIILGFQHYIVMLGTAVMLATVLVPQMGGNHVNPFPHLLISILMVFYFICLLKLESNLFLCYFFLWFLRKQGDKARTIQTMLFMTGVNTLLQTFIGTRLPTVMSPSFAFIIPVISIIRDFTLRPFDDEHEVMLLDNNRCDCADCIALCLCCNLSSFVQFSADQTFREIAEICSYYASYSRSFNHFFVP